MITENANAGVGAIGSACILGAYCLLTFSAALSRTGLPFTTTSNSLHYQVLNLIGGAFAAASALLTVNNGALPLAVLELVWAIIAFVGIVQIVCGRAAVKQPEEAPPPTGEAAPVAP